jgi:hypothetical protein
LGTEIPHESFTEEDFVRFRERLRRDLVDLETVLAGPCFGEGERTLGAELELFLIGDRAQPLPVSPQVVRAADNPQVTPEMGAFTIELATPPVTLAGRPFTTMGARMREVIALIRARAATFGARAIPISILPTLRREDFGPGTITDLPRYRALAAGLRRLRQGAFRICIDGPDPLELTSAHPAMAAANTAFQVHLRAAPREFASLFNAAMMLTGPVLAASGNSPTFLGHRLWHETRIALFKQADDDRPPDSAESTLRPARVSFGNGWVRDGAVELFSEAVALYEPILPVCSDRDGDGVGVGGARALGDGVGTALPLSALRLHHGTVWKWNRPVYDPAAGGHLRIELRALPAGPTVDDMLANAAFLVGGILALAPEVPGLLPAFPFALAERNFYRAAQHGLDAELGWPRAPGQAPSPVRAVDLLLSLLPRAEAGLLAGGVARDEVGHYLGIFERRVRSAVTGAAWQLRALAALRARGVTPEEARRRLVERYLLLSNTGQPVHDWPIEV